MLKKALTIEDISKICRVPTATVLRWIQHQHLKTVSLYNDEPKIWRSDLITFLESISEPIPRELVLLDTLQIIVASPEQELRAWIRDEIKSLLPNAMIVETAGAIESGMAITQAHPHLLILDLDLPGISRESICRTIKDYENLKGIKIITLGNKNLVERKNEILDAGADEFFPKPLLMKPFTDSVVFFVNELV